MSKKASGPQPPPGGGGNRSRRGTLGAIAEKRNKDLTDTVSAEDAQRKGIIASFATERDSLFTLYDDESRRVKDSLIAVLEKRLYSVRTNCSSVVAEAESSLESVLQGVTRLLLECHRAGMLVVQKLEQVSEVTPPPTTANSSASIIPTQPAATERGGPHGNRSSPPPPPALIESASSAIFEGINRIAPVVPVTGGSSYPSTPTPPPQTLDQSKQRIVVVEEEERIARFFHPELPENKLTSRGSRDMSRRLSELSVSIVALVNSCLTKLKTAHARIEHLERSLDEQVIQRASCEKMLGEFLVRGRTESDRVVERCRDLLAKFEGRMSKIEADARSELTSYIKQGADAALARAQKQDDPFSLFKFESNAITDGYLTTLERTRALHQQLLRDIELKVVEFSAAPIREAKTEEIAKLFRSGLPPDCAEVLQSEEHFDRASVLRLLEHVSFEPRTCEVITALIREYKSFLDSRDPEEIKAMMHLSSTNSNSRGNDAKQNVTAACANQGGGKLQGIVSHATSPLQLPVQPAAASRPTGGPGTVAIAEGKLLPITTPLIAAASIAPPCDAHLVHIDSNGHSIIPSNLYLTPFNKFWIERVAKEERGRQERLHAARFYGEASAGSKPSVESSALVEKPLLTTLQRRQLIVEHIGDGASAEKKMKLASYSTTSKNTSMDVVLAADRPTSSSGAARIENMGALAKAFSDKHRQLVQQLLAS